MVVKAPRGSARCGGGGSQAVCWFSNADSIEVCATRSKSRRSSAVNSAGSVATVEFSGSCDIALPSPAEDEGAAAALHHLPVDLGPEGDKVIAGGNQRQHDHEPDGQLRNPMDRKNVRSIDRPFFPAVVKDDGHHRDNLHQHFELAEITDWKSTRLNSSHIPLSRMP